MLWVFGRKVNEAILLCAGMVLPGGDGRRGCSDGVKPVRNSSIGAIPESPENGGSNRPYRPSSVICFANATFPQGGRLFRMRIGSCLFVGEGVPALPQIPITDGWEILRCAQNDNGTGSLQSPLSAPRLASPARHTARKTAGNRRAEKYCLLQKFFCNAFPFVFVL